MYKTVMIGKNIEQAETAMDRVLEELECADSTHTVAFITENCDGDPYIIYADDPQEIIDDWMGECDGVPANDATVSNIYIDCEAYPFNGDFEDFIKDLTELMS